MARKKKKSKSKTARQLSPTSGRDEKLEEELEALKAIYDDSFQILDDRLGCSVLISPHPADEQANITVFFEARFPAGYPSKSLSVLVRTGSGNALPAAQAQLLQSQLQATANSCAKNGEVAVFKLASDASDWLQLYIEEHPSEGQESLYDHYQQREQTLLRDQGPDVSLGRFAALTQQLVDQTASVTPPRANTVRQDGSAFSSTPDPSSVNEKSRALLQPAGMDANHLVTRTPRKASTASNFSSHGSPMSTAVSRSVGVASQLAQHIKGGRGTHRRIPGAPGETERKSSALRDGLTRSDVFQQAVIGASIHQTLAGQGLSDDERAATVELMQQAGVISRALGELLMQPRELKHLCASLAGRSGSALCTALATILQGGQDSVTMASRISLVSNPRMGDQQDVSRRPHTSDYQMGRSSVQGASPCRYHQDFIEHEQLGKGGFGIVVAAVNRVDGRKYAIKKIPMGNAASPARVLLEVSTLSGLYHAHVVRYFQAWREEDRSMAGMSSEGSRDLLASHTAHTTLSVAAGHGAGSTCHRSKTSVNHIHTNVHLLKETDALVIDGHRDAHQGRLDTVAETSADRGGSLPIESPSDTVAAIPDSTVGNSLPDTSLPSTSPRQQHDELTSSESEQLSESTSGATWSTPTYDVNSVFTFDKRSSVQNSASGMSGAAGVQSEKKHEILYIQMEYCPTTLRKQLARGPLEDEQRWRVVRQLLSSLAYVHRRGIIHRDVKPDNVFYDARNDIKLGDFGLAKFTSSQTAVNPGVLQDDPENDVMSSDVGTELYMAPEIKCGGRYGAKVDLFSLGVCVVEIWYQFATEMERICTLQKCHDGTLPDDMLKQHPLASRLALELLSHDPHQRPAAAEVLKSHLLPASVADEQVTNILRALPDNPGMYEKVVDALFAIPDASENRSEPSQECAEPLAFQAGLGSGIVSSESMTAAGIPAPSNPAVLLSMFRAVEKTCATHGFVPMQSRLIGTFNETTSTGCVRLLSMNGQHLSLRSDLRVPFCMWLVNQAAKSAGAFGTTTDSRMGLESMRRYEVAQVFTGPADAMADWHADIDVIDAVRSHQAAGQSAASIVLSDAEVLRIVLDIITSSEAVRGCTIELRLSHSNLLLAILDHLGVPFSAQASFLQAVLAYQQGQIRDRVQMTDRRQKDWAELCQSFQQMQVSIGRAKILLQQLPSDATEAVGWLRNVLPAVASDQSECAQALQQLDDLVDLLATWGINTNENTNVVINPFLPIPAAYHHSLIYQVYVMLPQSGVDRMAVEALSACELVCSGGRFDALLQSVWPWQLRNEHIPPPLGTGVTLDLSALERISQVLVGSRQRMSASAPTLSVADVLVAARGGGGMLRQRMHVVHMLWQGGISAETMHAVDPSLVEQYTHAKLRRMRCIVLLAQHQLEVKSQVKVKLLEKKTGEEDVSLHVLVSRLSELLSQRLL